VRPGALEPGPLGTHPPVPSARRPASGHAHDLPRVRSEHGRRALDL